MPLSDPAASGSAGTLALSTRVRRHDQTFRGIGRRLSPEGDKAPRVLEPIECITLSLSSDHNHNPPSSAEPIGPFACNGLRGYRIGVANRSGRIAGNV